MRTSFHHQPEAQHPNFQLSTSWQADYPIFRGLTCALSTWFERLSPWRPRSPRPRDTERPAQPSCRPDPPYLFAGRADGVGLEVRRKAWRFGLSQNTLLMDDFNGTVRRLHT